jgi:UDP-N-acetylmuramoylalanine--D-glutamate ligase
MWGMELEGKKVLVVGLGKTGRETIRFLLDKGAEVRASDKMNREEIGDRICELEDLGVEIEAGGHDIRSFLWADFIVLSPGVPFKEPVVAEALRSGKEVISEVELAYRFLKKPIIGVTGSNGKTTTVRLIAEILRAGGKSVFLGGNIGVPLISIAGEDECYDILVLELSSFQLQGVKSFAPFIGIILNISPNHLDHHTSLEEYADSKKKLFENQNESQFAVYNCDDPLLASLPYSPSRKIPFGRTAPEWGVSLREGVARFMGDCFDLRGMKLIGAHNMENAMAAIAAAKICGIASDIVQREILAFEPIEHRIEFVREIRGARVYNDSKSTSPGATLRALESFPPPITLIAGGKDKGTSYEILKREVADKVRRLVLIGEARHRLDEELGSLTETHLADTLEEAVHIALCGVTVGHTVLFSPACSSFDMFSSYEERGRRFKEIVKNL